MTIKLLAMGLLGGALLSAAGLRAQSSYQTILDLNYSVAGARASSGGNVVLAGSYLDGGNTLGMLYQGPIVPTNPGGYSYLTPTFGGQTVTTSRFYGPDTAAFNPGLGVGNISAVGSYQYSESGSFNHGMMYRGPLAGGGFWTPINVPSVSVGGAIINNTVPRSTMGNLIVGNYDLDGVPDSGNAFLYNSQSDTYTIFEIGGSPSNEVSAQGIWQNGIGSTSYTIAGGAKTGGVNKGFLVDYDSLSEEFTHLTFFDYSGPGVVTQFDGITGTANGFNLIATSGSGALVASVPVNLDGSFGNATWTSLLFPGSDTTTGSTVYDNYALGLYTESGSGDVHSYVVSVPEPAMATLLAASGALALVLVQRWRVKKAAPRVG